MRSSRTDRATANARTQHTAPGPAALSTTRSTTSTKRPISKATLKLLRKQGADVDDAVVVDEGRWGSRDALRRRRRRHADAAQAEARRKRPVRPADPPRRPARPEAGVREQHRRRLEAEAARAAEAEAARRRAEAAGRSEARERERARLRRRELERARRAERRRARARERNATQFPTHWRQRPRAVPSPQRVRPHDEAGGGRKPFDFSAGALHPNYVRHIEQTVAAERRRARGCPPHRPGRSPEIRNSPDPRMSPGCAPSPPRLGPRDAALVRQRDASDGGPRRALSYQEQQRLQTVHHPANVLHKNTSDLLARGCVHRAAQPNETLRRHEFGWRPRAALAAPSGALATVPCRLGGGHVLADPLRAETQVRLAAERGGAAQRAALLEERRALARALAETEARLGRVETKRAVRDRRAVDRAALDEAERIDGHDLLARAEADARRAHADRERRRRRAAGGAGPGGAGPGGGEAAGRGGFGASGFGASGSPGSAPPGSAPPGSAPKPRAAALLTRNRRAAHANQSSKTMFSLMQRGDGRRAAAALARRRRPAAAKAEAKTEAKSAEAKSAEAKTEAKSAGSAAGAGSLRGRAGGAVSYQESQRLRAKAHPANCLWGDSTRVLAWS
jgi:hypothetical protein